MIDRRPFLISFALLWFGMAYIDQRQLNAPTLVSRENLLHALVAHRTVLIAAYHRNPSVKLVFDGRNCSDKAPGTVACGAWSLPYENSNACPVLQGTHRADRKAMHSEIKWMKT